MSVIEVPVNPPYKKELPKALNEFGIPEKPFYRTEDVAKILRITSSALQWRFRRRWYPETRKDAAGRRIFAIEDVAKIVAAECRNPAPRAG